MSQHDDFFPKYSEQGYLFSRNSELDYLFPQKHDPPPLGIEWEVPYDHDDKKQLFHKLKIISGMSYF